MKTLRGKIATIYPSTHLRYVRGSSIVRCYRDMVARERRNSCGGRSTVKVKGKGNVKVKVKVKYLGQIKKRIVDELQTRSKNKWSHVFR